MSEHDARTIGRRSARLARLTLIALLLFQVCFGYAGVAARTSLPPAPANQLSELSPEADLSVTQFGSPDPVDPDSDLTYSIEFSNAGPEAATGVMLTDPIPSGTSFVFWSAQDFGQFFACSAPGQLSPQSISCFSATFPAGAVASFTLVVHVDPGLAACSVITNTVTVSSATPDPDQSNNGDTATTDVTCP
jgi:uncharacterized repeat protein (TIGR01451 family)